MGRMIKENIGPRNGSAWENETREGRRRQKQTQEWKIEIEIPLGLLSSRIILLFIFSVSRRRRRGNHSSPVFLWRMRQRNRLPLIASLTPESCRFLTDILQLRWRGSNGGDFGANESEEPYQTRGHPDVMLEKNEFGWLFTSNKTPYVFSYEQKSNNKSLQRC